MIKKSVFAAMTAILLLLTQAPCQTTNLDKQIEEKDTELQDIKVGIEKEKGKIKLSSKKVDHLEYQITRLQRKISTSQEQLRKYQREIDSINAEIEKLDAEIEEKNRKETTIRSQLKNRIKKLNRENSLAMWQAMAGSTDYTALVRNKKYDQHLAVYDAAMLRQLNEELEATSEKKQSREEKLERLNQLQDLVMKERAAYEDQIEEYDSLLPKVRKSNEYHKAVIKKMEQDAINLSNLLVRLQKERAQQLIENKELAGVDFEKVKGNLPWPVKGELIMTFGENKDPVFGTPIDSQGLDIKADKGTQVTSIAAGMIIYAGWFEGFGNVVILDHQNSWVSLYAHLDKIAVIQGEMIGAETPIGTVGDTDTLVGSALKFQLRKNNKPLDPVPWLVPLN